MKGSYALVTARTSSTRLPRKCLQEIVPGVNSIQIVIRRAKKIGCPVILATTEDSSDDVLADVAEKEGVSCFRGAVKNKIRRWADCFAAFDVSEGLLVDGDDPTFDYNVGARALEQLRRGEADMAVLAPEMTPGFFTYGITRGGMEKLLRQAPDKNTDTDVITEFVSRAGLTKSPVMARPGETDGHDLRLTIDYPEDVEFYRELHKRVDYLAPAPEIVKVALAHSLQKINWHKHEQFLENQRKFNEKVRTNG